MRHNCQGCGKSVSEVGKIIKTEVPTMFGQPGLKLCKICRDYVKKERHLPNRNVTRLSY